MILKLIKDNPIISFILFIALVLRIYGIIPGYPDIHPDENTSYHTAINLLYNFFNPSRFDYPAGMPLINALVYVVFFIPLSVVKIISSSIDAFLQLAISPFGFFDQYKEAIFGYREIYAMYWSRAITAVFGVATVLIVYITGKKLFTKEVGLFAAFFLAVNYLHVVRSHFGLPDIYNGFFAMLSLYASALLLEKNTKKRYLFAGFAAGMVFAVKYQVFALLPFIAVHTIWAFRKKSVLYFFHKNAFYAAFVFILTFLVTNPYYLFNIDEAIRQNRLDVLRYRMGDIFLRPYGYFYLYHWGIGKLPSIMVVLGIIFMLVRSPLRFTIVAPFAFVFMFFMTVYSSGGIFPRNFATVMPYLMLFAGYSMGLFFEFIKRRNIRPAQGFLVVIGALFFINADSIRNSYIFADSYAKPWNINIFTEWVEKFSPKDVIVRRYQLFHTNRTINAFNAKNIILKDWDYSKGVNSLAEFQEDGAHFAVLNTEVFQNITYWWRGWDDPKLYLKYNSVPYDFIQNDFYGLTIKELLNYTIFEAYKPWQAHNSHNYIVFKIPQKPKDLGKKISSFNFDTREDIWKVRGNFEGYSPLSVLWSDGELVATSSSSRSRIGSRAIPVEEGKLYSATGFVKTVSLNEKDRDGFLRIDFYSDPDHLDQLGMSVAISKRALATGEWEKLQVSMVAPKESKFMTVSFQFKEAYSSSTIDNVELFEAKDLPKEQFKEIPYIKPTIPLESLYYNTFI